MSNKKNLCHVCWRFASKAAIDKYNAMLSRLVEDIDTFHQERDELQTQNAVLTSNSSKMTAENVRLQETIGKHDAEVNKLNKTIADQAKHITCLMREMEAWKDKAEHFEDEILKLYGRSWWQRLLNMIPE